MSGRLLGQVVGKECGVGKWVIFVGKVRKKNTKKLPKDFQLQCLSLGCLKKPVSVKALMWDG